MAPDPQELVDRAQDQLIEKLSRRFEELQRKEAYDVQILHDKISDFNDKISVLD